MISISAFTFDSTLSILHFAFRTSPMSRRIGLLASMFASVVLGAAQLPAEAPPVHADLHAKKPQPWPGGIIPYDISNLAPEQQTIVRRAMQRWMDTGAQISFVPRTNQQEYVFFTGNPTNGNNTSLVGYKKRSRAEINITPFWWRQEEWMIVS